MVFQLSRPTSKKRHHKLSKDSMRVNSVVSPLPPFPPSPSRWLQMRISIVRWLMMRDLPYIPTTLAISSIFAWPFVFWSDGTSLTLASIRQITWFKNTVPSWSQYIARSIRCTDNCVLKQFPSFMAPMWSNPTIIMWHTSVSVSRTLDHSKTFGPTSTNIWTKSSSPSIVTIIVRASWKLHFSATFKRCVIQVNWCDATYDWCLHALLTHNRYIPCFAFQNSPSHVRLQR